MWKFIEQLTRLKVVDFTSSELRRVLGVVDLTLLGVGSTIGVGIYVLAGQVSRNTTGPAVTISFLIAAVASLFAGLCYAEFGARVPKAGSAYIYTYVCIGEFVAFIIGWNLILEYVIGTASVARGFSLYVDALANNTIEDALYDAMPLVPREQYKTSFLSPYPDFLAFGLAVLLSVALALGVKESSRMNNIFTSINIVVIVFVIIGAGTQGKPYNWNIPASEIDGICNATGTADTKTWGTGGFAPFGFKGIMEGAATCFFGFVGFDIIATTGEEALNPARTIPISIGVSLFVIFLSYFGVSAVITLAIPYCLQDEDAPLVVLFDQDHIGWEAAKWFVSIGALFGFSASLFGAMFPLPRVIYAMASDGLMFRFLARVSKRFQTPTFATAVAGVFAGAMAMLFNLDALVNMMSIGTLMAYTIVALCVLLLRYTVNEEDEDVEEVMSHSTPSTYYFQDYMRQLFNTKGLKKPTPLTASLVTYAVLCFCVVVLILDVLLVVLSEQLSEGAGGTIAALVVVIALNILILTVIARQPVSKKNLSFKVPLVPWIPALSTFINLYLMCNLHVDTWIRFAVWMAIGFINYFAYGLWNSALRTSDNKQGLDNLAFTDDRLKNHQLIIPKIEIQPATPLSSEPNTPVVKPRHTTPPPKSPLATGETQSSASDSWDTKTRPNEHDKTPLDAMAVVASLMKRKAMNKGLEANGQDVLGNGKEGTEGEGKDVVGNDKASLLMMRKSINKETGEPNEKGFDGKEGGKIEGRDLGNDMRGSEGSVEGKVLENVDVSDGGVFSTSIVSPALPSDSPFDVRKAEADTQMAARDIQDVIKKTEEGMGKEESKEIEEIDTLVKDERTDDSSNDRDDKETGGNINNKEKHNKPPPFTLPITILHNQASGIPRDYYSSPELSPPHSPPPSPPPPTPTSPPPLPLTSPPSRTHPALIRSRSEATLNRSVPTTPVTRRHPIKVLRRMSSFDDIPPSSPDSPFAVRVGSFFVIPVPEPGFESDGSIPPSPSDAPSQDLFQAVDKLNRYKTDEDKRMFTVGSADSLDNLPFDASEGSEFLSPRRGVSREPDMLDPIRERGESKLYISEADKTEIQPS